MGKRKCESADFLPEFFGKGGKATLKVREMGFFELWSKFTLAPANRVYSA